MMKRGELLLLDEDPGTKSRTNNCPCVEGRDKGGKRNLSM